MSYLRSLVLFFSFILFPRFSNCFGYCVDSLCSFKCCQDFYTCAVSADCQSPDKPYTWPYPEGSACSSNDDCLTDCCWKSKCYEKSTCTVMKGVIAGCICLGFLVVLWIIQWVIRKKRKTKEERAFSIIKASENEMVTDENSTISHHPENFNPQSYCDEKLAMNLGGGPIMAGGMPHKPDPNTNMIKSNFRISTQ